MIDTADREGLAHDDGIMTVDSGQSGDFGMVTNHQTALTVV